MWVRRLLLSLGLLCLSGVLLAVWWLEEQARPRHEHFVERRGQSVTAELETEVLHPGNYLSLGVRLQADTELTINLRVLRPADADGPVPLMVMLAGYRLQEDAVNSIGDPGEVAVAVLDYPYQGPARIRNLRQFLQALSKIQQAMLDTPPAISLALDWLETQAWVDPGHVELVGVSLGTPFVAVAGGLDERFRRVWIIHGGAGNQGWIEHNLGNRIRSEFWRGPTA